MHSDAMNLVVRKSRPTAPDAIRGAVTLGAPGRIAETPFVRAAETIAAWAGRPKTVVDVMHQRAVRHHAEALRQYLVLRLGDVALGERALAEVRALVATEATPALVAPPGVRAQLFRRARDHARAILARDGAPSASARQDLPYRIAPGKALSHALLQALRVGLPDELSELLELRYARELGVEELAFVVGADVATVEADLAEATARVERLVRGREARERGVPALVVDALALVPATNRETAETSEVWEPLPFGTIVGSRYAIERRVGSGAFGDVYRAKDTEVPGHVVALKLLHHAAYGDDARKAALRELRLIASVFHPSVVQFKDHGWHEGRLWFVMPWYDGETLEQRIERGPLARDEALRIFEPLARALAAMHAAGVRHQDVKPDNVFLAALPGSDGDALLPVLLDLGVAATEAEIVVAGTPTYFAPEVAAQFTGHEGAPRITLKADVFSLALALRNALEPETKDEVRGGAVEAFIAERAVRVPSPPSDPALRFLAPSFRRWMSIDPDERPTAAELAAELSVLVLPERKKRRRRALLAAIVPIVAIAAMLVGGTIAVLGERARRRAEEAAEARAAAATLREDLDASEDRARALEARARAVAASYEASRSSVEEIAADLVASQDGLERARREVAALGEERDRLREELASERRRAEGATRALDASRAELESQRARITRFETELASAARTIAERGHQLAALEARVASAEADESRLRAEAATLSGRLSGERARAERLEQALAEAEAARARAEGALARGARSETPPDDTAGDAVEPL